jgi:hypothetical protein
MKRRWDTTPDVAPQIQPRRKKRNNDPAMEARAEIIRLTGVDLAAVAGIGDSLTLTILSEMART